MITEPKSQKPYLTEREYRFFLATSFLKLGIEPRDSDILCGCRFPVSGENLVAECLMRGVEIPKHASETCLESPKDLEKFLDEMLASKVGSLCAKDEILHIKTTFSYESSLVCGEDLPELFTKRKLPIRWSDIEDFVVETRGELFPDGTPVDVSRVFFDPKQVEDLVAWFAARNTSGVVNG